MGIVTIRDAAEADYEAILALNLADVAYTSPMDRARLATLTGLACHHRVACIDGQVSGFLLAMRSGARYENDNFAWFTQKYPDFVYVDRVVVSSASRGLRLGSLLYEDLFDWARRNRIPLVTCEYNLVPANEPSRRFHEKFGFREQGTQWVANRTKQVSLQAASPGKRAPGPHLCNPKIHMESSDAQQRIDALIARFLSAFDNRNGARPQLSDVTGCFTDKATIVRRSGTGTELYTAAEFAQPRIELLTQGALLDFHEWETSATTQLFEGIAARISRYRKSGVLHGAEYSGSGTKCFHLVDLGKDWRIASLAWADDVA